MRKSLIAILVLGLCTIGTSDSHAKKSETGKVIDGVTYVDARYGFSFKLNGDWKIDTQDEEWPKKPDLVRFKTANTVRPAAPQRTRYSWTYPYGAFLVDTTSMSIKDFVDFLKSDEKADRKSKQRKAIEKVCELMTLGELVGDDEYRWHGLPGRVLTYRYEYEVQEEIRGRPNEYELISSNRLARIYIAKSGGRVFAFQFESENEDYRQLRDEIEAFLQTLRFEGEEGYAGGSAVKDSSKS